jgi:hypothetical protein
MGTLTRTTRAIIGLFTSPGPNQPSIPSISPQHSLEEYLNRSYKNVKAAGKLGPDLGLKTCVPISIFLKSKSGPPIYAGNSDTIGAQLHHLDEEECYSASLIKVAAMFAAFKLRAEAKALINDIQAGTVISTTQLDFFNKLKAKFNLGDAVTDISSVAGNAKGPSYGDILSVTGFPTPSALVANFSSDFRTHLRKMIIPSDNCSAGECTVRLSFPYINVKLMEDGFYDKTSKKGIWLCGDYIQSFCPPATVAKKQKYVTIDTINDCNQATPPFCGSAQNTTSKQMASFFYQIMMRTLVDPLSSDDMHKLLREAQHGSNSVVPPETIPPVWPAADGAGDTSFLTRTAEVTIPLHFSVDAVKIGQGPIKTDTSRMPSPCGGTGQLPCTEVRSEGILIKWNKITSGQADFDADLKKKFDDLNLTGDAAICWQNLPNQLPSGSALSPDGVVQIINTCIDDYVSQAPLP